MSGIPKGTIDRFLAKDSDSCNFETAIALVMAVGGSLDEAAGIRSAPVDLPEKAPEDTPGILSLLRDIIIRLQIQHKVYDRQRDAISAEYSRFRGCVFSVSLLINAAFFALLIYDFTHPEIGWVRYDLASYLQQGFAGGVAVCSAWWSSIRT